MAEILGHTMRKFGQKFGAAKINMLEKIGKRDTTESPEMQNEARVRVCSISQTLLEGRRNSGVLEGRVPQN